MSSSRRSAIALLIFSSLAATSSPAVVAPSPAAQDAPKSDAGAAEKLGYFMARKLGHSQGLFAALAVSDLERASQEAQKLSLLSLDEQWNVLPTPEYGERSQDFRRTIAALDKAARAKDLSGAQLEYLQLAGQCFSCHRYLRDTKGPRRQ